jgi:Fe-S cluster assembly protein SufD
MTTTLPPPAQAEPKSWPQLFEQLAVHPLFPQPPWLLAMRRSAIAHFSEWGLPTTRHEEWRYTSLSALNSWPIRLAPQVRNAGAVNLDCVPFVSHLDAHRVVFLNGRFAPALSSLHTNFRGSIPVSLAEAIQQNHPLLAAQLARHTPPESNALVALNTAFFNDGALLVIPAGQRLDKPIQIVHLSDATEAGEAIYPRNLIVAESASEAVIIEHYAARNGIPAFINPVTEIVLGDGARLEHCRIQNDHEGSIHIATTQAIQAMNSVWKSHSISLGARLARHDLHTRLDGEGAECVLNGLYLAYQEQLVDHHTVIDHAKPHCNSHEFYHGILAERGRGVFNGKIFVRPGAQKTDAKQTNRNLLLSDEATVDTKPQLEIFADDVKCTHGATVGHLDEEPLFYLRSRGIGLDQARRMLIHAFAGEIVHRISVAGLREAIDQFLLSRWNPALTDAAAR